MIMDDDIPRKMSFTDLIKSRNPGDRCLSESSRDLLHNAVFQLIQLHQDTKSIVNELSKLSKSNEQQKEQFSHVLSRLERRGDESVSLTVTEACARRLLMVTGKDVRDLEQCFTQIQVAINQHTFNSQHFVTLILAEEILPMLTLWSLHIHNLLTLTSYITRKMTSSGFMSKFSSNLYKLCLKAGKGDNPHSENTDIQGKEEIAMGGLISVLINAGFPEKKEKEGSIRKVAIATLDGIIKNYVDNATSETPPLNFVQMSFEDDCLCTTSFKKYCTHTLSLIMSHRPSMKVSQAFKQQSNWKYAKTSDNISSLYKQLFLPFECGEILEVLQRILERQEVNWQTVLSFIATYLLCYTDAARLVQGHIQRLLSEGLENGDMESTIIAFLLARQCCMEGVHVFPAYQDWFQQTFSDPNKTPAPTRKSFSFLVKFLSSIVPYETAPHLKVHILRPPHVPAKCRQLLAEYITLAKTRLTDLKESVDVTGGIYDTALESGDSKQGDPVEADVEKSLTAFQSSGKVPSTVMEASIFRKPYFIGKYLKALLKPRHLPDKADTRMKMIECLRKADKIPASMYTKYTEGCQHESKQLLEGVFDVDSENDPMQDAMLSPLTQLQLRLEQLHNIVTGNQDHTQHCGQRVAEIISIISEKLENFHRDSHVTQLDDRKKSHDITISDQISNISHTYLQTADALLNGVCHMVSTDLRSRSPVMTWLTSVLDMMSQHPDIHHALIQRIANLVITQLSDLSDHHITGLSALVSELSCRRSELSCVTDIDAQRKPVSDPFVQCLLERMDVKTGQHMQDTLRFLTCYLEYTFLRFKSSSTEHTDDKTIGLVSSRLIRLFTILCWRLHPETRLPSPPESSSSAVTIFTSSKYQHLLQSAKVTPDNWVEFEISICPEEDRLDFAERLEYYNWTIYEHFLVGSVDLRTICSVILNCLVNKKRSSTIKSQNCQKCEKGENSYRDNSLNIFSLLQSLVHHLPHSDANPWLLQHIQQSTISKSANDEAADVYDDVSTQSSLLTLFSYVCRLPPYFLIVNTPTAPPTPVAVATLVTVLEDIVAPHLSTGVHLLSHLVLHLIQACMCVGPGDSVRKLLLHPLITVSAMVHWGSVTSVLGKGGDNLPVEWHTCIEWVKRCIDTGVVSPCDLPAWLRAIGLFSRTLTNHDSVTKITKLLIGGETDTEVVCVYVELSALTLAEEAVQSKLSSTMCSALRRSCTEILKQFPHVIAQVVNQPVVEAKVASMSAKSLKKIVLLQLLCKLDTKDVQDKLSPDIISRILNTYQHVCHQFQHNTSITLTDLTHCATFLKSLLMAVPVSSLASINQTDLKSLGPDFHHLVMSRLRDDR